MEAALTDLSELTTLLAAQSEWLIVRENGVSFPVNADEVEVTIDRGRAKFAFVDDGGFQVNGLRSWNAVNGELAVEISSQFNRTQELIRLVPRTSAGELVRQVELARIERASEIAHIVQDHFPHLKLNRVALNAENGRFAEVIFEEKNGPHIAMLSDVTESLTPESILASAFKWIERLRGRSKKPIGELWIAAPKRQIRALQKLCALLRTGERSGVRMIMLQPEKEPRCAELRSLSIGDLWREKPKKLVLPEFLELSAGAKRILELSTGNIDVIHSKQGETLRFLGLPFARVRTMLGREKAWIGVERERTPLTEDSQSALSELIDNLDIYRRNDSDNRRHRHFTLSPESWLESILLRNIKLLDANLILSPIYNQFRAARDKIDLLALRRDGRLVIIELKTSPDREMVFQAADYWRKIELQRRSGQLAKAGVFGNLEILDQPALVYAVAPALSFHRDFEYFARKLSPEIELWRFELHENWRGKIKVIARKNYTERS